MTRQRLHSARCSGSGALTSKSFTRRSTGWWASSSASNAHWPGATCYQAREALKRAEEGEPLREIALSYNVDPSTISRLKARHAAEV